MKEIMKKTLPKEGRIDRNSYSIEFKSKVVNEVLSGQLTKAEAQRVYEKVLY